MSLKDSKLPTLKEKLEAKISLEKELQKVDDAIDEITKPVEVKIIKSKKK